MQVPRLCLGRRLAKFHEHAVAQSLGIALAGFRKVDDLACDNFVCQIAAISKPKRYQRHVRTQGP